MLIDTHCHLNIMIKDKENILLNNNYYDKAKQIVDDAQKNNITTIINIGTNLIESNNCIILAQWFTNNYAVIGIHPNDITSSWQDDLREFEKLLRNKKQLKIVGIGECGLDFHYPDYNINLQKDLFRAQIELALHHDIALVVHTRDAHDETLRVIEEYKNDIKRGIIHCFSEDLAFAQQVIEWHFAIGLGGTITYPKNHPLREVAQHIPLSDIVLETDAPFLAPQVIRGKTNSPSSIALIAHYLAQLRSIPIETVAQKTTKTAEYIFKLH